jgi:hypothetical protein
MQRRRGARIICLFYLLFRAAGICRALMTDTNLNFWGLLVVPVGVTICFGLACWFGCAMNSAPARGTEKSQKSRADLRLHPSILTPRMDAHGAAEQIAHPHLAAPQRGHFLGHSALGGIGLERFMDVGQRGGIAAKNASQQRNHRPQVKEKKPLPKPALRLAKIKHQQPPAGPRHPRHFLQPAFPTFQIPQSIADADDVE